MDQLATQIAADPASMRGKIIDPQPKQGESKGNEQGDEVIHM